jgi:hypothetical protein
MPTTSQPTTLAAIWLTIDPTPPAAPDSTIRPPRNPPLAICGFVELQCVSKMVKSRKANCHMGNRPVH